MHRSSCVNLVKTVLELRCIMCDETIVPACTSYPVLEGVITLKLYFSVSPLDRAIYPTSLSSIGLLTRHMTWYFCVMDDTFDAVSTREIVECRCS